MKCKCCEGNFIPIPNDKFDTLCEECTSAAHIYEYECPSMFEETIADIIENSSKGFGGLYET